MCEHSLQIQFTVAENHPLVGIGGKEKVPSTSAENGETGGAVGSGVPSGSCFPILYGAPFSPQ